MSTPAEVGTQAYSLRELLEASLIVPLRPRRVFALAAARPAPGFPAMIATVAFHAGAFFAVNLARFAVAQGGLGGHPAQRFAVGAALALLFVLLMSFVAAAGVHALALVAGGEARFSRSYQAVAMTAALLPIAALSWPLTAALPVLWGAAVGAAAVEHLHGARALAARVLAAASAALLLFSGWVIARRLQQAFEPYATLQRQLTQLQSLNQPIPAPQALEGMEAPHQPAPARVSGLDLLSAPRAEDPGAAPEAVERPQAQSLNDASANLLGAALPMLNDPTLQKNLDASQKKQLRELTDVIAQMQEHMRGGRPMTERQRQEAMAKIQKLMPQLMMMGAQPQEAR